MPPRRLPLLLLACLAAAATAFVLPPPLANVGTNLRGGPSSSAAVVAGAVQNADGLSLEAIYKRLKMEVLDLDEGVVGVESRDPAFGIEIVKAKVKRKPNLGLELVEVARGGDGRGLVLVGGVSGNAAQVGLINVGDTITYIGNEGKRDMTRVEGQGACHRDMRPANTLACRDELTEFADFTDFGLAARRVGHRDVKPSNILMARDGLIHFADFVGPGLAIKDYDSTVEGIEQYANEGEVTIVLKRLVQRQTVKVVFEKPTAWEADGTATEWAGANAVPVLAGSNLRTEMIRKGIPVYDERTKRFDQPYATGNCGGEGICGTCFVEVQEGAELLSKPDNLEKMVCRKLPTRWRLSCRTVVGAQNEPGEVRLRAIPQNAYVAERKRQ